jgi:uncharacterized cupin superfamily protein
MSDPVIAKLPLRVYTPIPDLQYNDTVAEDIRELPNFVNVNMGETKTLAPVVCQVHEPHESLRTVPWVKPTGPEDEVAGEDEIERGVWHWVNGRWIAAIPEFETLTAIEDEVELIALDIDDTKAATDVNKDAVALIKGEVSALYDSTHVKGQGALDHTIRALQLSANSNWMFGSAQAIIPASQGVPDPDTYPAHATIDFTGSVIANPSVAGSFSATPDKYRAFCFPAHIMGLRLGLGDIWSDKSAINPWYSIMSRPTCGEWNTMLIFWQDWQPAANPPIPALAYPSYTKAEFARNFGYYFGMNGAEYTDPVIFIEFAWTGSIPADTHPQNLAWPLVQLTYTLVAGAPNPLEHYVTGFKVWFGNIVPSGATPEEGGVIATDERRLTFNWAAYGQRRTPPELWT